MLVGKEPYPPVSMLGAAQRDKHFEHLKQDWYRGGWVRGWSGTAELQGVPVPLLVLARNLATSKPSRI